VFGAPNPSLTPKRSLHAPGESQFTLSPRTPIGSVRALYSIGLGFSVESSHLAVCETSVGNFPGRFDCTGCDGVDDPVGPAPNARLASATAGSRAMDSFAAFARASAQLARRRRAEGGGARRARRWRRRWRRFVEAARCGRIVARVVMNPMTRRAVVLAWVWSGKATMRAAWGMW